jgi:hypothetical protein
MRFFYISLCSVCKALEDYVLESLSIYKSQVNVTIRNSVELESASATYGGMFFFAYMQAC